MEAKDSKRWIATPVLAGGSPAHGSNNPVINGGDMKSEEEIDQMISKCLDRVEAGKLFPGMTYGEDVRAALDWVLGNSGEEDPFE